MDRLDVFIGFALCAVAIGLGHPLVGRAQRALNRRWPYFARTAGAWNPRHLTRSLWVTFFGVAAFFIDNIPGDWHRAEAWLPSASKRETRPAEPITASEAAAFAPSLDLPAERLEDVPLPSLAWFPVWSMRERIRATDLRVWSGWLSRLTGLGGRAPEVEVVVDCGFDLAVRPPARSCRAAMTTPFVAELASPDCLDGRIPDFIADRAKYEECSAKSTNAVEGLFQGSFSPKGMTPEERRKYDEFLSRKDPECDPLSAAAGWARRAATVPALCTPTWYREPVVLEMTGDGVALAGPPVSVAHPAQALAVARFEMAGEAVREIDWESLLSGDTFTLRLLPRPPVAELRMRIRDTRRTIWRNRPSGTRTASAALELDPLDLAARLETPRAFAVAAAFLKGEQPPPGMADGHALAMLDTLIASETSLACGPDAETRGAARRLVHAAELPDGIVKAYPRAAPLLGASHLDRNTCPMRTLLIESLVRRLTPPE